jgi:outer membrane protein assembly factor BamB
MYHRTARFLLLWAGLFAVLASVMPGHAGDWTHWRGPLHNGASSETGLVSTWSLDGNNLAWKADFVGRSTPIIMNGKVYVIGRTGAGITAQRHVACFDAQDGRLVWEHKSNVAHTTVPFSRVGWASMTGDPETGNVYAFGVDGTFTCYEGSTGDIIWEHSHHEEYFMFSGYGGRTATPFIDEDLVIISHVNNSWGDQMPMRPRFLAYDKKSGDLAWITTIASPPKNTGYSSPVLARVNGLRAIVCGANDGNVYAFKARTGEIIWHFNLSKDAFFTSVVVEGEKVYASHGAENLDSVERGRVVCFSSKGSGDITKSNEIWRNDGLSVGFASPLIHNDRLYVITNAGNLLALDAGTGKEQWKFNLGTVGKGSPVWADGKIFATEVNGKFHILQPGQNDCKSLDAKVIMLADGSRYAEIYGSPAIAYGRVYFASEAGLFSLGNDKDIRIAASPILNITEAAPANSSAAAAIQIVPAEIWMHQKNGRQFHVRIFDQSGLRLPDMKATFSLADLRGEADQQGFFRPAAEAGYQAGYVVAQIGELVSKARVQVYTDLPFEEDFDQFTAGKNPPLWPGAAKFEIREIDGNKMLAKTIGGRNLERHNLFLGPPQMTGYTIQADIYAEKYKRKKPDLGLIANRYYLDLMGKHQNLQVRSWPAELRMMKEVPFAWDLEKWYTMKMRVDIADGKAYVKGKVWPRDQREPADWSIVAEDPLPNRHGSPGLYGWSATDIYYDNVKITRSR